MSGLTRAVILLVVVGALAAGAWLASRATSPDRRNLDALVTVAGDAVRDTLQPAINITRISSAEEVQLGKAIDSQVRASMPLGGDARLEVYLQEIVRHLSHGIERRDIPYVVSLVRSADINAFAVAGGRIYVTEGMLDTVQSEAELAAILAHEMSHVDLRHCVERLQLELTVRRISPGMAALARVGYELMLRGFSEEQELAADANGSILAARISYDPWAANQLFERWLPQQLAADRKPTRNPVTEAVAIIPEALGRYLATHPPADQRIEAVSRRLIAQDDLWRDKRMYVGRWNLEQWSSMSDKPREEEWITRAAAPGVAPAPQSPGTDTQEGVSEGSAPPETGPA